MPYSVSVQTDITYRRTPERPLSLDLYRPDGEGPHPVVGLIHGGGWEDDHRGMFQHHLTHLAQHGYAGLDLTHRLSGEATYPAAVRDVKAAVGWVREHADDYGFDPDRVALGGHSSGAHLSALVAVTPEVESLHPGGDQRVDVQAALPMNGPYDLNALGAMDPGDLYISGFIERLFGATRGERPDAYREASPHVHLDGDEPPFLLLASTDDEEVPWAEAPQFAERLREAGVHAELEVADRGRHLAFTNGNPFYEEGVARMHGFLDEQFGMATEP